MQTLPAWADILAKKIHIFHVFEVEVAVKWCTLLWRRGQTSTLSTKKKWEGNRSSQWCSLCEQDEKGGSLKHEKSSNWDLVYHFFSLSPHLVEMWAKREAREKNACDNRRQLPAVKQSHLLSPEKTQFNSQKYVWHSAFPNFLITDNLPSPAT